MNIGKDVALRKSVLSRNNATSFKDLDILSLTRVTTAFVDHAMDFKMEDSEDICHTPTLSGKCLDQLILFVKNDVFLLFLVYCMQLLYCNVITNYKSGERFASLSFDLFQLVFLVPVQLSHQRWLQNRTRNVCAKNATIVCLSKRIYHELNSN